MPLNGRLTKAETTALEQSWLSFEGSLGPNQLLYDLDELLLTRGNGQGLKLYDALLNDAHTFAVLNKLSQAITSREWTVTPAADKRAEKKAADLVREQLTWLNARNLNPNEENHSSITGFDSLTRAFVIGGVLNGRHFAEVMWGTSGMETAAIEVRSRDPRQFSFAKGQHGYVLRHMTREQSTIGVEVPLKKVLVWSHGALDGSPYGRALGRVLWWPNFFKRNGIRFWLKFIERFAAPKPTGKYPRGATRDQIAELRAALAAISNETEIALPEGVAIEYLEAAQSGTIDTYESLCKYMDDQISRAVLGETGTTDQSGSGGSRARDQVADGIRIEGAKSIADSLSTTFNRLSAWITEFNYPGVAPPTIWRVFDNQEDLDARIGRDKTLFDFGYRLNAETVASVYGEGYEEALGEDKPALIASLGVPGVQALTGILQQAASGGLPRENAIAVLVSVFGIAKDAAAKMVPDAPPEQPAQANPLTQLFGGQDGTNGSGNGNASGGTGSGNNTADTGTAFSEDEGNSAIATDEGEEKDPAELIADKARQGVQDAIAPWLSTVREFVEQATTLEEIRDGLIDLYSELDDTAFAEAMGQAMLLSDLAGREEVLEADEDIAFAEAIERAIGGTLDFAAKKSSGGRPNCNPAKSHFCQTPNGRGSCVPLSKKCKFPPTGAQKEASDWKAAIKARPPVAPSEVALKRSSKAKLALKRSNFVEAAGEDAVQRAEANLKKVFDKSEVFIRCKSEVIDKILADRFKSQFETGTSGGALAKGKRAKSESESMDYPKRIDKSMRPIYGYWGDTGKHHETNADWYGEVVVRLKQSARERATFTVEDSLPGRYPASAASAPNLGAVTAIGPSVDKPKVVKLGQVQSIKDLQRALETQSYIEAQVHGQVTPDDIAEIIFTEGSRPSAYAKKWAKSKGVKLSDDLGDFDGIGS